MNNRMRRKLDFHLRQIRFGIIRFGLVRIPKLRYSVFWYFTRFGHSLLCMFITHSLSPHFHFFKQPSRVGLRPAMTTGGLDYSFRASHLESHFLDT